MWFISVGDSQGFTSTRVADMIASVGALDENEAMEGVLFPIEGVFINSKRSIKKIQIMMSNTRPLHS